jgi:single-strand DNA-binding protein
MNINRVLLTANLTRDPELRSLSSGLSVCGLRVACNTRRKNGATGEWEEKPNYFDVSVFGAQAESCNRYLTKGRMVAIDGRLDWREWEQDGAKRQAVQIIAESVQFLSDGQSREGGPAREVTPPVSTPSTSAGGGFYGPPGGDDIPFAFPDFPFDRT